MAGGTYTRVRLDRALADGEWSMLFPQANLSHKIAATSDHNPILLELDGDPPGTNPSSKQFRYEVMWEAHDGFQEEIHQHWQGPGATTVRGLKAKLDSLSKGLRRWDKNTFGNVRSEIK